MKKIFFCALALLGWLTPMAQNANLVVFSDFNEPFLIWLNGVQMRPAAVQNLRITDLPPGEYKVRMQGASTSRSGYETTLQVPAGVELMYGYTRNQGGGAPFLRFYSSFAMDYSPATVPQGQVSVVWTAPRSLVSPVTPPATTPGMPGGNNGTTSSGGGRSGSGTNAPAGSGGTAPAPGANTPPNPGVDAPVPPPPAPIPGYTGKVGCPVPVGAKDFEAFLATLKGIAFDDSQLKAAKRYAGSNCLLSSQVEEILRVLQYDSSRLDFAKFAYAHTYDQSNYMNLNDAFQFSSTADELGEYVDHQH